MLVVLVGFATGTLFGYKGGVILVQGLPFSNNLTQYDDFVPGSLFDPDGMDPFSFTVDDFDVEWLTSGMARGFDAELRYTEAPGDPEKSYDLRVNHPLKIGGTELFLIGHGYAPVVTVRDGDGNVAASGPVPFLPMGPDLFSFGVIKAPDAKPGQIGLEGYFYPTFANVDGTPVNLGGNDANPLLSLNVYTGDLNLDSGASQSVYTLDKSQATAVPGEDGKPLRVSLAPGDTVELPNGLGSVTFDERRLLAADPDQPDAGQGRRAAGGRAGAARADGVAVHPLPPGVAARHRGPGRHPRRGGRTGPLWRRRYRRRTLGSGRRAAGGTAHDQWRVGHAEQPGGRGRRGRLLPGAAGARRRVVLAAAGRPLPGPRRSRWLRGQPSRRPHPTSSSTGSASRCSAGSRCCSPDSPRPSTCSPWWLAG